MSPIIIYSEYNQIIEKLEFHGINFIKENAGFKKIL